MYTGQRIILRNDTLPRATEPPLSAHEKNETFFSQNVACRTPKTCHQQIMQQKTIGIHQNVKVRVIRGKPSTRSQNKPFE